MMSSIVRSPAVPPYSSTTRAAEICCLFIITRILDIERFSGTMTNLRTMLSNSRFLLTVSICKISLIWIIPSIASLLPSMYG